MYQEHKLWPILEEELGKTKDKDKFSVSLAKKVLRSPKEACNPKQMASVKESRLSFSNAFINTFLEEKWKCSVARLEIDENGKGEALYHLYLGNSCVAFYVLSQFDPEKSREGRLADDYFDCMGVLFDGIPSEEDVNKERDAIKKLWKGRAGKRVLGWTLANRSTDNCDRVVEKLLAVQKPDIEEWDAGHCYLLRNAGFYGNGKQGGMLWEELPEGHGLRRPYFPEMLALLMWRRFGTDLVEEIASKRNPGSSKLDEAEKKLLGIGNSSGLGMVAVLSRWPWWVDAWISVREAIIALLRTMLVEPNNSHKEIFLGELKQRSNFFKEVSDGNEEHRENPANIREQLLKLHACLTENKMGNRGSVTSYGLSTKNYFQEVLDYADKHMSKEAAESVRAAAIAPFPELAKCGLAVISKLMTPVHDIDPKQSVMQLREEINENYSWIKSHLYESSEGSKYFWYRSTDNGEHRRGEREVDLGEENEILVDIAGLIYSLLVELEKIEDDYLVGELMFIRPDLRHAIERVHSLRGRPYAEIHDRPTREGFLPLWIIRFYLSALGLQIATPKNWRWVRGVFFSNYPVI